MTITRIKLRRDTSINWSNYNPVLEEGEVGLEMDTKKMKVGDGVTPWNDLPYFNDNETNGNVSNLNDLDDVIIHDAQNGQVLVYKNGAWRNEKINSGNGGSNSGNGGSNESEINNIFVAKNIDALTQIDTSQIDEKIGVIVAGYHDFNDGGGGIFYWDKNEPKANHNGGTIIDPDKTFPSNWNNVGQQQSWFTANNNGTGCWKRVVTDKYNVKWFGAKGDNYTDDFLAIKTAKQHCNYLFFPRGIYRVSAQLRIPKGATWEGIANEAVPQYSNNTWDTSDYGSVLAITFGEGNNSIENSAIILTSYSTLRGINIWYPNQSGSTANPTVYPPAIALDPSGDAEEHNKSIVQARIEKCVLVNPYYAIDATASHEMLTIKDVKFTAWKKGIVIHKSYDVDRLIDIHSNPNISYKGLWPGNSILDYHKNNDDTIGLEIAKADQIYVERVFIYGFYHCLEFSIRDGLGVNDCVLRQCGFEGCSCCVWALSLASANIPIRRILFEGCTFGNSEEFPHSYVLMFKKEQPDDVPTEIGLVDCVVFTSTQFSLYLENISSVNVNSCKFYDSCRVDQGWETAAIYVKNCKNVTISDSVIALFPDNHNCIYYHIDASEFVRIVDCFFEKFTREGTACAAISNGSAHVQIVRPFYSESTSEEVWVSDDCSDVVIDNNVNNGSDGNNVQELNDLNDVTISGKQDGQLLIYKNGEWKNDWFYLKDLRNVSLSGLQQGHVLVYRNGKWRNEEINSGNGGGNWDQNLENKGWVKMPNGLILQWGEGRLYDDENDKYFNFNIDFPHECFAVFTNALMATNQYPHNVDVDIWTSSRFHAHKYSCASEAQNTRDILFKWFAIGY